MSEGKTPPKQKSEESNIPLDNDPPSLSKEKSKNATDEIKNVTEEVIEEIIKNDQVEYLIGMKHAFMLLKPIIKKSL